MTDPVSLLKTLRRPRLLIRAARFGLTEYRRERDLSRLVKGARLPSPVQALNNLMEQEAALEEIRKSGEATYSIARHIEVLVAMMAEARLVPQPRQPGNG